MEELIARILIIDDDVSILDLLSPVLSNAGFAVETAQTAQAALKILERETFDLIIMDVVLPGDIDGTELVRYARARQRTTKVLFISGIRRPTVDQPDSTDFVQKPFRPAELLGSVFELLLRRES
jgi:two-component system phosphate regulon response regulator OmpR